mgnify:CR=1 FL=1
MSTEVMTEDLPLAPMRAEVVASWERSAAAGVVEVEDERRVHSREQAKQRRRRENALEDHDVRSPSGAEQAVLVGLCTGAGYVVLMAAEAPARVLGRAHAAGGLHPHVVADVINRAYRATR